MRIEEGDSLAIKYPLIAIYLYGYAAEMILKAAYFKNLQFGSIDEIDRETRNRAMALAQMNGFMARDPHDIPGWARLLVWDKQTLHTPAYDAGFSRKFVAKAITIYENWRPQMRYRNTTPHFSKVATVRSEAKWLISNYIRMGA